MQAAVQEGAAKAGAGPTSGGQQTGTTKAESSYEPPPPV